MKHPYFTIIICCLFSFSLSACHNRDESSTSISSISSQMASPSTHHEINKFKQIHHIPPPVPAQSSYRLNDYELTVVQLINAKRIKKGLTTLHVDMSLCNLARKKANDMQKRQYFSHVSPTFGSPFTMLKNQGITYQTASETIAKGPSSAQDVIRRWLSHKKEQHNIFTHQATSMGIGYIANGGYWVLLITQNKK